MKIIAITTPKVTDEDAIIIRQLLARGIHSVHLRKPDSDVDGCRRLLAELTAEERAKIIIHDYPELYYEFSLKGIHINRNVTSLPQGYNGFRSRSCHSFEEVIKYKDNYGYVFLSPIFDSISKAGYKSCFSDEELQNASREGVIDDKVIALGGVTLNKMDYLRKLKFGGAAMIGAIYHLYPVTGLQSGLQIAVEGVDKI